MKMRQILDLMYKPVVKMVLAAVITLVTLTFGWWPFNFFEPFSVSLSNDNTRAEFTQLGFAFLEPRHMSDGSGFLATTISLDPRETYTTGLARILGLSDYTTGKDRFIIGQWHSDLIIRTLLTDVETKKEHWVEKGIDSFFAGTFTREISISYSDTGLYVSVNGNPKVVKQFWSAGYEARWMAGNSPLGDAQWKGSLYLVANDSAASALAWQIPKKYSLPHKQILTPFWVDFKPTEWYARDVLVNIIGFMPFGFIATLIFSTRKKTLTWSKPLYAALTVSFIFSLCIELGQIYLPLRASQLSDLLLNTFSGLLGALVLWWAQKKYS